MLSLGVLFGVCFRPGPRLDSEYGVYGVNLGKKFDTPATFLTEGAADCIRFALPADPPSDQNYIVVSWRQGAASAHQFYIYST